MNPFYQSLMNGTYMVQPQQPQFNGMQFQNPQQKMQYMMQAMMNPAAFVRQAIPDIPVNISNDPNQILQYLKQTRGITDQQIQQIAGSIPPVMGR